MLAGVLQADQGSMVGQDLNVGPLQAGKLMVEAADASKPDGEVCGFAYRCNLGTVELQPSVDVAALELGMHTSCVLHSSTQLQCTKQLK